MCLKKTMNDLEVSTRLDRHVKLDMYVKLRRLIIACLNLCFIIASIEIWLVFFVIASSDRLIIFDLPPTLAWDISLFVMMIGFGYIWRPSPATAQFSYFFARQDDDGFDTSDPVNEFGLETS